MMKIRPREMDLSLNIWDKKFSFQIFKTLNNFFNVIGLDWGLSLITKQYKQVGFQIQYMLYNF
jgi:hypothetical protein